MLPKVATLATYGGALADYSAPRDTTTDRSADGTNPAYADVAAMTHTAARFWARFQPHGTSPVTVPVANAYDATWNNKNNAVPSCARTGVGTYTVTAPATVYDEIPPGAQGSTPAGFAVNFRMPSANLELGASTNYDVRVKVTAPNVLTVETFTVGTSSHVDPNDGTVIGVWSF